MALEDQLLQKIDANLCEKNAVILEYGQRIERMREYSFANSIEIALAEAFNNFKNEDIFKPADFEGYSLAHTSEHISAYEEKFGFKTFVFNIVLPKQKWSRFLRKVKESRLAAGLCYARENFTGFFHGELMFGTFGIVIECEPGKREGIAIDHEALHCDRAFYSSHWDELSTFHKFKHYDAVQTAAKIESRLADELLCYLATGCDKSELTNALRRNYLPAEARDLYNHFEANTSSEKEKVKKWLRPLRNKIDLAVDAAYSIRENIELDIMVPLFFSLGPTMDDMAEGSYGSVFNDIIMLDDMIKGYSLRKEQIVERLQAKGFLRQPEFLG